MPIRPQDPSQFQTFANDISARLRAVERRLLRAALEQKPLQTYEDGSLLGDTLHLDFTSGLTAVLTDAGYVEVSGSSGKEYATVVVAASDTHQSGKDVADFACDGTADQVTIQEAITSVPAGGGEIVLLEGTYVVSGTISLDKPLTIRGMGYATNIQHGSGGSIFVVATGSSQSSILNCRIDCNSTGTAINMASTVSDLAVISCWVGNAAVGIDVNGTRCSIIDTFFTSNTTGIEVDSSTGSKVLVMGCSFSGTTGIQAISGTLHNRFVGCHFETSGRGIYAEYAMAANNTFLDSGSSTLAALTMGSNGVSIGNTFRACVRSIEAAGSVVGNYVRNSTDDYIRMNGGTCLGNTVENDDGVTTGGVGIRILAAPVNATVIGNRIRKVGEHGIVVSAANDCIVSGNWIFRTGSKTDITYDGILVTGNADRNNIQGNTIRTAVSGGGENRIRYGVNIDSSTGNDNLVTNNDLKGAGTTADLNDSGTGTITAAGNRF